MRQNRYVFYEGKRRISVFGLMKIMDNKELREKYRKYGFGKLTDEEKLRLILSYSENENNAANIVQDVLGAYGSLKTVFDSDLAMLRKEHGISEKSLVLLKLVPVAVHLCDINSYRDIRLNNSENAKRYFSAYFRNSRTEVTVLTAVKKNFRMISTVVLAYGDSSEVSLSAKKVIDTVYSGDSDCVFLAHCHPHGNCSPSDSDVDSTMRLFGILDVMNIFLADHIITAGDNAVSLRETCGNGIFGGTDPKSRGYTVVSGDKDNQ